jgi:POT family proton-dependent oligopeptide transporter
MAEDSSYGGAPREAGGVFDQPRGLLYLCIAEGWERFSYFGMQSLLVLYLTHHLLVPGRIEHVLGMGPVRSVIEGVTGPLSTAALASQLFGLYTGFVYLTPLLGGLVADRWLGRTATITIGGLLMVAGHLLMGIEAALFPAILLLLVGVGCFKGNIAGQVGELYPPDDLRRATGYQLFQLSISFSVILAPLLSGTLGERVGWGIGFASAGVGMVIGLGAYLRGRRWLPPDRVRAGDASAEAPAREPLSSSDWKRVMLLVALLPVLAAAMVGNQQMFNAFVVWGEASFDLTLFGWQMPATWLLSIDAALAVICLAATIWFWRAYARRRREPDDIVKLAIGVAFMATAPLLLALGSGGLAAGGRISVAWGIGFELINEIGFATVVPVGLSLYSRTAPSQITGLTIGLYYLNLFVCNVVVGRLGGLLEQMPATSFWLLHAGIIAAAAAVLAAVAIRGGRLLTTPVAESA